MVPDKNKIAADCWKRGNEALAREQWDYAVDMATQAMALVPENVLYRKTLRGATKKKYKDNGSGARMASMKLMKVRGRMKKAQLTKDWPSLDKAAEEGLKINPWDATLNAAVGEACQNIGLADVAIFGYEEAIKANPDSKDYNRAYALLQEERGNYQEAIVCWRRIYKMDSLDTQARSKMTQLEADTVINRGGYEGAESTRDVKTGYDYDRPGAAGRQSQSQQDADGPGMSAEADMQRAIRKEPASKDNYLKLADFYKREGRLDEAAEMLKTALDITGGGDHTIREQLEDVELDQLRHNQDLAKDAAKSNPEDETARKNSIALARELIHREIEVLSGRVERYPQDSRIKFDLAKKHKRLKEFSKAIPLLQQASGDTRLEREVLVMLGECFFEEKKLSLALRQFEKAHELVNAADHLELFKKINYALGRLYEIGKKNDLAEKHYQEVLGVDYEYRDTLKRLEKLQADDD
jgi:tetratricopeptide (TPR) repeat protein